MYCIFLSMYYHSFFLNGQRNGGEYKKNARQQHMGLRCDTMGYEVGEGIGFSGRRHITLAPWVEQ